MESKTISELVAFCKANDIKGYSGKKKSELLTLISKAKNPVIATSSSSVTAPEETIGATSTPSSETSLKMIDLFAGTGAFTLALEGTGKVKCVFANDNIEECKKVYDLNFEHKLTLKDINTIDVSTIPSHDILTGGFPCQPFSIAGKQLGFDDSRSNVFWAICKILEKHQPKCFILENVKNLLSHDDGNTFKVIKENLIMKGYHIQYKVLNTAEITGVPQHRERIYIVGFKSKALCDKFNLDFPEKECEPVSSCFLEEGTVPEKYYYKDTSGAWDLLEEAVTKRNTIYQYRRVYVRENKSGLCPTLTANMGGGGHNVPIILDNKGIRKLTPRECFRLQGFPESYRFPAVSDLHLYKLAGNAVSVPVVKLIAERLVKLLLTESSSS